MSHYKQYILFSYLTIVTNVLTGFILVPLIIKHLGLEALGIFGILFSLKSIVDIGISGVSVGFIKNLVKYKYLQNRIITFSFLYNNIYGLTIFTLFLSYSYFVKNDFILSSLFFGIYILLNFSTFTFYEVFTANNKQHIVMLFRFIQQFIFMLLSIATFIFLDVTSLYYLFITLSLSALSVYILAYLNYKNNYQNKIVINQISKTLVKTLICKDGLKFVVNNISTILLFHLDIILIDYLYGSKSAAIYLIVFKVPNTIIMLGFRLSEPLKIMVVKKLFTRVDFFKQESILLVLSILFALLYILFGEFILTLWLGKEQVPTLEYMYVVSSVIIVQTILSEYYMSINYYSEKIMTLTNLRFIEVVFKVVFILFFFNDFFELSPIYGWMIALFITLPISRKYSLDLLKTKV